MKTMLAMTKRNIKLFFKDKGMFFTSLITPGILLLLYSTFLGNVYKDAFYSNFPDGFTIKEELINGFVGAQLMSSILAVSCVTVAFCSNMLMVQDKSSGTIKDLTIAPVKSSILSMSYFLSTFISTFIVCSTAAVLCLVYVAIVGFYMSAADVFLIFLDTFLLTLFGTSISSIISFFLNTQGQMSAVGTIVSAGYGFICGAYMPISQFSDGLQKFIMFLPGTYGTSLMRIHSLRGVISELEDSGIPKEVMNGIMDSVDCNLYFFDKAVSNESMYAIIIGTSIALIGIYIFINYIKSKIKRKVR